MNAMINIVHTLLPKSQCKLNIFSKTKEALDTVLLILQIFVISFTADKNHKTAGLSYNRHLFFRETFVALSSNWINGRNILIEHSTDFFFMKCVFSAQKQFLS